MLIGVWEFNQGEQDKTQLEITKNELETQQRSVEFHRKLWLEQLSAYKTVAEDLSAIIIASDNSKKSQFEDARHKFGADYFYAMLVIGDKDIKTSMRDFYFGLSDFRAGFSDDNSLKIKANALMEAIRKWFIERGFPN